jgi:hypothetical protein
MLGPGTRVEPQTARLSPGDEVLAHLLIGVVAVAGLILALPSGSIAGVGRAEVAIIAGLGREFADAVLAAIICAWFVVVAHLGLVHTLAVRALAHVALVVTLAVTVSLAAALNRLHYTLAGGWITTVLRASVAMHAEITRIRFSKATDLSLVDSAVRS